jgi:protein-tyrosine phosphatase
MDDGSGSVGESIQMLDMLDAQGVDTVALTPHYYRSQETISSFMDRRERSVAALMDAIGDAKSPRLLFGAETALFMEMSLEPDIQQLCIGESRKLLVEMPFNVWTTPVINEVRRLIASRGVTPIIAHIERYAGDHRNREALSALIAFGAIIQSNAEFFLSRMTRRKAFEMLRNGQIHVFGSDAHNVRDRAPNMGELGSLLNKKLSASELYQYEAYNECLIR